MRNEVSGFRLDVKGLLADTISQEDRFENEDFLGVASRLKEIRRDFELEMQAARNGRGRWLLRKNWREWTLPWIDPFMPEDVVLADPFDMESLLPKNTVITKIIELANRVREEDTEAWVHIGIGGSIIPTKALVNSLISSYHNDLTKRERGGAPKLYWTGDNFSPDKLYELLEALDAQGILFKTKYNVISKSGTTQETIGAYLVIRDRLRAKLEELHRRYRKGKLSRKELGKLGLKVFDIQPAKYEGDSFFRTGRFFIATTGFDQKSALYQIHRDGISEKDKAAPYKGGTKDPFYAVLPVSEGTGGRFTSFTPVGLLALATMANSNYGQTPESVIYEAFEGIKWAFDAIMNAPADSLDNPAFAPAAISHIAEHMKKKSIKIFYMYDPKLQDMGWWWNELYSESLQEMEMGINTKPLVGSSDNHMDWNGIIAGPRDKIIRFVMTDAYGPARNMKVPQNSGLADKNVSAIEGFGLGEVQNISCEGTARNATAPKDRKGNLLPGVLNYIQHISKRDIFHIAALMYFSMTETAALGRLNGLLVQRNDDGTYVDLTYLQEWVEGYKENTRAELLRRKAEWLARGPRDADASL